MKKRPLLEVCTGCVCDSVKAFDAGADRIELNSALELGGLSPSPGSLTVTVESVGIPVIAMVRPYPGGFVYSAEEKLTILRDADFFLSRGAAGVAVGALTPEGRIDQKFVLELRKLTEKKEFVFHRAFDLIHEPFQAASELAGSGVDRILTSGGHKTAFAGKEIIRELVRKYRGVIEILPGSGISSENASAIVKYTSCTQIHGSFSRKVYYPESVAAVLPESGMEISPSEIERTIKILSRI